MKVVLDSLCEIVRGSSPRPQGDPRYYGGPIPRLMVSDVTRDGMYVTPQIDSLTEEGALKSRPMKKGDVVIAVSGDAGEPCILNVDACIHDGFVGLRNLNEEKVFKPYLYQYLKSVKLQNSSLAVGAIYKNLNTDQIRSIPIPLPPLCEQKRIAELLDAADTLRKKDKALLEKYDQLAQSLFLEMFGDPVKNEKGWEMKKIENLVKKEKGSIKRGPFGGALKKEIFVDDGYLVYEQFHALNNDFSMARYFITESKFHELKGFEVKPKDIIISCSGVYLGKLAIVPDDAKKGIINQALLKLTLNEEIMRNDFFVFQFQNPNFKEKYFESNRGAGIPNFPPISEFKEFQFFCPPISLQNQFAEQVQLIEQQKEIVKQNLEKSEELMKGLMGEVFG